MESKFPLEFIPQISILNQVNRYMLDKKHIVSWSLTSLAKLSMILMIFEGSSLIRISTKYLFGLGRTIFLPDSNGRAFLTLLSSLMGCNSKRWSKSINLCQHPRWVWILLISCTPLVMQKKSVILFQVGSNYYCFVVLSVIL